MTALLKHTPLTICVRKGDMIPIRINGTPTEVVVIGEFEGTGLAAVLVGDQVFGVDDTEFQR